ncbi:putative transposase [Amycolatopsis marina]|uniref:Putative transposase n=1 Tax=Amycolatopsis marina TaxID=490629 RepID=A0A1I1CC64_9PSEU|nr:IS3 family transposase [Amycolatopsis marina]SFB59596.1 putative transposase [Amycolatopsis marina]SFB59871.1 putative transposase [Amycolatopsis marina]
MKAQAVLSLKAEHSLEHLLAAAGLARSTFFYHQARSRRGDPQTELKAAITTSFENSHRRYGHRRVHAGLVKQGWRIAKKTVLKLMRQLALICRVRRRRRYNSYTGEIGKIAPNLLAREFTATAPNQKWVTDVTEFVVGNQKVYLSPIMDLFDRQIIAYGVSSAPTLTLTNTALGDALATLGKGQTPLVHSDQGFQYQHASWRRLLARAGATQSMSRKGNCLDNAVIESFFGHLKEELFHHATFLNTAALTTALHEYIAWHNNDRSHTTLKGLSPVQYRTQALVA